MTTDPYQLPPSCHALQRGLLLTDGYVLHFLRNFFSISMLIGQLAVLQQHLYIYFIVLLGCLKTVCVRVILIHFTKAFDIADHTVLMSKLAELQLPGNICSWVGSFLTAHQQVCHFNGEVSML